MLIRGTKVVQTERNTKQKTFFLFLFPRCSLACPTDKGTKKREKMQMNCHFFRAKLPSSLWKRRHKECE